MAYRPRCKNSNPTKLATEMQQEFKAEGRANIRFEYLRYSFLDFTLPNFYQCLQTLSEYSSIFVLLCLKNLFIYLYFPLHNLYQCL